MAVSPPKPIGSSQSLGCVCLRAHQGPERPLSGFRASPHPIADWIPGIAWCGPAHILLSAGSDWKWAPRIFCCNLELSAQQFCFWPFRLQRTCPQLHKCVDDLQEFYYKKIIVMLKKLLGYQIHEIINLTFISSHIVTIVEMMKQKESNALT